MPNTLFLLGHIGLYTSGVVMQNVYRETYGKQNNLITNFYLITEFISNMIIYLQCATNQFVLNKTVREFDEVAQMIRLNFGCEPELNTLFKQIRKKMFWILLTYTIEFIIYLLPLTVTGTKLLLSLHLDVLQSGTIIGCMHGILYINLLNFYMKTLNQIFIHSMSNEIHHIIDNEQFVFLNKMKILHFRLWNIAQNINQFFGCGLGAIFLRNFVDATFGIYWSFLIINNRESQSLFQLIRMCGHLDFNSISEKKMINH